MTGSRPRSTERLLGASARLLAATSVLCTVGLGLGLKVVWQQSGQNYSPDGSVDGSGVTFDQHLAIVIFELSFRQLGLQLLLASALVGAAVLALHRHPSWSQVRLVRWEVLAAGVLALVPTLGLVLANLYVVTPSDDATRGIPDYMGRQPLTELVLVNLSTLVASALTLGAAGLWWLRLERAAEVGDDEPATEVSDDEPAADEPGDVVDDASAAAQRGIQHWSPEDFRRPPHVGEHEGRPLHP